MRDSFATPRLQAERVTADHLADIQRMHADAAMMAYLGGVRDDQQTLAYLARNLRHWDEYGHGLWMLRERGGGPPIGRAVLRHVLIEGTDEVEIGYGFLPAFWGKGLATEIATACLAMGRERLHLTRMVALTHPDNAASQHVLAKVGLEHERRCTYEGATWALFATRR